MRKYYFTILLLMLGLSAMNAQQLAFPGAEGYGKFTIGGRGGKVCEVTNLNDSGTGSLRAAVEASGPRIIVFKVSGTIVLNSNLTIKKPYITIAGQTAPGDGICIRKFPLVISASQVIIRYIRVRFGDESGSEADAVSCRYVKNLILDHVSASWSVDETMSIYHCDSVTVQWCMISESMYNSNHAKGAHGFGGIAGSNYSTYHHNLLAHHSSRNPRIASGCGNFDYRNNVIYNWGYNSCYGGEKQQVGDTAHAFANINLVANYYKPGPATKPGTTGYRIANPSYRSVKTDYGKWFIDKNIMLGNATVTNNNWNGGVQPQGGLADTSLLRLNSPWPALAFNQQDPENAYYSVLDNVGATLPKRDTVDARVISDARSGGATFGGTTYKQNQTVPDNTKTCGIIDSQTDVGGWPLLNSTAAPADSDHDGMPDSWETSQGLNVNNAEDRNTLTSDGYTMLEKYLNGIEFEYPVTNYKLTKLSGSSFQLSWADNYLAEDGFIVERSYNGVDFEAIATLPGYSNSYTDNTVSSKPYIVYRVIAFNKANRTPGSASISYGTYTNLENIKQKSFNSYPNPFQDALCFDIPETINQDIEVKIFDITGKLIAFANDKDIRVSSSKLVWNDAAVLGAIKSGTYLCSLIVGGKSVGNIKLFKI